MTALRVLVVMTFVGFALVAGGTAGGTDAGSFAGWVAYEREQTNEEQGGWWIAVARTNGRSARAVTPRPGPREQRADHSPAWSANGRLAFVRSTLRSTDLLVTEPVTWQVRRASRLAWRSDGEFTTRDEPSWSPDESRIAWPAWNLFVIDVARRTRLRIAGAACAPRWSPDGQTLLFLVGDCDAEGPQHPRVELVGIETRARRVIARGSFNSADWSPDGRRIAYAGDCESRPGGSDPWCRVLLSNADGSGLRRLPLPASWVVDWVRWTDDSTIVAGGSVWVRGRQVGLVKIDVDERTASALAPSVVGAWPTTGRVTADGSIAVVTRFDPRPGSPVLIDVASGSAKRGRAPAGWPGGSTISID